MSADSAAQRVQTGLLIGRLVSERQELTDALGALLEALDSDPGAVDEMRRQGTVLLNRLDRNHHEDS